MEVVKASDAASVCFGERFRDASVLFVEIVGLEQPGYGPAQKLELLNAVFWAVRFFSFFFSIFSPSSLLPQPGFGPPRRPAPETLELLNTVL